MSGSDPERREALLERLLCLRERGRLSSTTIREAALAAGVSERTVRRWVADGQVRVRPSQAYRLTERDLDALYAASGRCSAAWEQLAGTGVMVSLRTFQRAVVRELAPAERAYARAGEDGRRRYSVYRRWEPSARNEVWQADHAELDVEVLPLRGTRRVRPWLTVVEDCFSRLIMGWALSLRPSSAEVLAALRMAIVIDPERCEWGGVPELLRFDGGKEFLAEAVRRAAGELGCAALPTAPYSPHLKGKVERLNRTIGEELIATLPYFTGGPRRRDGSLFAQPSALTLAQLQGRLRDWIDEYNARRPHTSLGGLTPAERWAQSAAPLDVIEAERLRWMLLADQTRRVNKDGIHFGGEVFIAPQLAGLGGRKIEVRYMPHDLRTIEVFFDGRWVCTARPHGELSADEAHAVIQQRHEAARETARRKARASRKARARVEPLTGDTPVRDITVVTRRHRPNDVPSEQASGELLEMLGMRDRLNRPADAKPVERREAR